MMVILFYFDALVPHRRAYGRNNGKKIMVVHIIKHNM